MITKLCATVCSTITSTGWLGRPNGRPSRKRYGASLTIVRNLKSVIFPVGVILFVSASAVSQTNIDCAHHENNEYSELRALTRITSTYIGAAGTKPSHVVAYECLMESENRDFYLNKLVKEADIGGQLYALAGLKALGASEFDQEMTRFEGSNQEVRATLGCVGRRITVGEAMDWIKEDQWPEFNEQNAP